MGSPEPSELCDCSSETWPSRRRRYFIRLAFVAIRYSHVENVDSTLKFLSPRNADRNASCSASEASSSWRRILYESR